MNAEIKPCCSELSPGKPSMDRHSTSLDNLFHCFLSWWKFFLLLHCWKYPLEILTTLIFPRCSCWSLHRKPDIRLTASSLFCRQNTLHSLSISPHRCSGHLAILVTLHWSHSCSSMPILNWESLKWTLFQMQSSTWPVKEKQLFPLSFWLHSCWCSLGAPRNTAARACC